MTNLDCTNKKYHKYHQVGYTLQLSHFEEKSIEFPASKLRYHGERDCRLCKRCYREVLRAQSEQLWHLNVSIVLVYQKSNRKQSLERGEKTFMCKCCPISFFCICGRSERARKCCSHVVVPTWMIVW